MIFDNGAAGRLPYQVAKVTETVNNLIINGETYDKKTLSKVTQTIVDQGYNGRDMFNDFFNTTMVTHVNNSRYCSPYYLSISRTFVLGNLNPLMSVLDNRDGNIEWTIAGDTVFKFDSSTKAYTTYRSTTLSKSCFSGGTILHQDDNYIYFLAEDIYDEVNFTYHTGYILDKSNGKITKVLDKTTLYGSYSNMINILENKSGTVIIQNINMGTHKLYKAICASGKIELSPISLPVSYDVGNYCNNIATKLDSNNYSYYLTVSGNKLSCVKIVDGVVTGDVIQEVITDSTKIKVDDFLTNKYSLGSIDASVRAQYLTFTNSYVNTAPTSTNTGYRQFQCSLAGDNDQFLVINNATDKDSLDNKKYTGDQQTCFIAVFRRNDPDNDPMDLTLVDYIRYDEFVFPQGYPKNIYKFDNKKYFMSNDFGHMELILNNDTGKFDKNVYYNPNLITSGYDSYGRLITLSTTSQYVEIFNDRVPNYISIGYKKPGDCYVEYDGLAQTKQISVEVRNIYNKPIEATFELRLEGSAEFTTSSSKIFRGRTGANGKTDVSVKILNPSKIVIGKKIIHSNELSYSDS